MNGCLTPGQPQSHRVFGIHSAWPCLNSMLARCGRDDTSVFKRTMKEDKMKAEVRRLTPLSCERLMGFPDNYTACMKSEAARYAACGNSWASNCARFVIQGVHKADEAATGLRKAFKYGTISSGVECHTLAADSLGDKAIFYSEISPAPVSLLKTHYPDVPILGDMTLVDYDEEKKCIHNRPYEGYKAPDPSAMGFVPYASDKPIEIPCEKGEIDIVSGGTPCQSFSLAGNRAGGAEGSGTRSSLAFQLPRIGKALNARWLLWENVPGAFTSAGGRDFMWFCYRVMEAGYSLAWRTLDAQYVRSDTHPRAVPQRRRRIWLVAYKGNDWRVPCSAIFEPIKVLGSEPPTRAVGIGFTSKAKDVISDDGKSRLDEFREFVSDADKKILDALITRGISISVDERIMELSEAEKKTPKSADALDLFGSDFFGGSAQVKHQGVGLKNHDLDLSFPNEGDINKIPMHEVYTWAKSVCSTVLSCGPLFANHDGEATVDALNQKALENIGNAGFISNGVCVTMKMPEWNAGLTMEALTEMPDSRSSLYDGDVCGLSDILEDEADPKYKLSWRACYGILTRAVKRAKKLPIELGYALIERIIDRAPFVKWQMENGKSEAKEGSLSDKEVATRCYENFISFAKPYASIEAVNPKEAGIDDSADDDAHLDEDDDGGEE